MNPSDRQKLVALDTQIASIQKTIEDAETVLNGTGIDAGEVSSVSALTVGMKTRLRETVEKRAALLQNQIQIEFSSPAVGSSDLNVTAADRLLGSIRFDRLRGEWGYYPTNWASIIPRWSAREIDVLKDLITTLEIERSGGTR